LSGFEETVEEIGNVLHYLRLSILTGMGFIEFMILMKWLPDFVVVSGTSFGLPITITFSMLVLLIGASAILSVGWRR